MIYHDEDPPDHDDDNNTLWPVVVIILSFVALVGWLGTCLINVWAGHGSCGS